jgi:hypothetical protein
LEQALAIFQRLLALLQKRSHVLTEPSADAAAAVMQRQQQQQQQQQQQKHEGSAADITPPELQFGPSEDWTLPELIIAAGYLYFDIGVHLLGAASPAAGAGAAGGTGGKMSNKERQALRLARLRGDSSGGQHEADALPYFRHSLEHFLLVKSEPSVAAECARAVQNAHDCIKACYVAYFETAPMDSDFETETKPVRSNCHRRLLTPISTATVTMLLFRRHAIVLPLSERHCYSPSPTTRFGTPPLNGR